MNAWKCKGCGRKVVGSGSGFGLRAIGWYVQYNRGPLLAEPEIYCPDCRPDKVPCADNDENQGKPCALCRAEAESKMYQDRMDFYRWVHGKDDYGQERDELLAYHQELLLEGSGAKEEKPCPKS